MAIEHNEQSTTSKDHSRVVVGVNNKPVTLESHRVTGREIKQAAVDQGVEIELDFILVEDARGGHESKVIGDDDDVTVNKHSTFTANDGDDNSHP
jgi:hypothetical protein